MGIGDWGLGIGPNPQSPIPNIYYLYLKTNIIIKKYISNNKLKNYNKNITSNNNKNIKYFIFLNQAFQDL